MKRYHCNPKFLLAGLCLLALSQVSGSTSTSAISDREFERLTLELSERGGYFGTDNLVSNETSFLHADENLIRTVAPGQVYLGVGPSQNYTYIAKVKPSLAFILDIRRDNLLYHLYFKSLFHVSRDRWEFLGNLFAKPVPQISNRSAASVEVLFHRLRGEEPDWEKFSRNIELVSDWLLQKFPSVLDEKDRARIYTLAAKFVRDGFDVRYEIPGRPMLSFFPSYGDLMVETNLQGQLTPYLDSEDAYQWIRRLQEDNRVVPVVGNFGGQKAIKAIGAEVERRGLTVGVFYLSNVEFYLFRNRIFRTFVENVRSLPVDSRSLMVRSYFNNWFGTWRTHPHAVRDYFSTTLVQFTQRFVELDRRSPYQNYWDLVTRDYVGAVATPVGPDERALPPPP